MVRLNFLLAILPGILIGWFIYSKDKNKESKGLLIKLFLGGVGSCFLTLIITFAIQSIFPSIVPLNGYESSNLFVLLIQVLLGVALIEEFSKWFLTYQIGFKHKEFDETFDAVVYCSFVALGFATFENVLYVFLLDNQLLTALLRAVTAVPGHVCDAIIMGYFFGLAKRDELKGFKTKNRNLVLSVAMPMFAHAMYDFLLLSGSGILVIVWIMFVILFYTYAIIKLNKISKTSENFTSNVTNYQNNPVNQNYPICPYCHNYIRGQFCAYCGYQLPNNQPPVQLPQNDPNICSGCGAYINSNFCPYCGKKQ